MNRVIGIASSPNTDASDRALAVGLLRSPARWGEGKATTLLEEKFRRLYGGSDAVSFESGRVALYQILRGFGIGVGDEVIVQAFTCVVVPDAVIWTGAKPIYADVDDSYNLDPLSVSSKIGRATKAVIVQHTFGVPANMKKISPLTRKFHLKLIEDCAHLIDPELAGKFGDAVFFSFGQEKAISSTRGGMALSYDRKLGVKLRQFQLELPFPSQVKIVRRLLQPLLWRLINRTYYFLNLGKAVLFLVRAFKLTQPLISKEELVAERPSCFPERLANAQAVQALHQLSRIEKFNSRRCAIGLFYREKLSRLPKIKLPTVAYLPYLRWPIEVEDPGDLRRFAKKYGIILGNWFGNVIYPQGVDFAKVGYVPGSCPRAERAAERIANLPNSPYLTPGEAKRVVEMIKDYATA